MVSMWNRIMIISLIGIFFALLGVAKEAVPAPPPGKAQPIPVAVPVQGRGHRGHGQRGHGQGGHGHGQGHHQPSKGAEIALPQYICPSGYVLQENNTCYREIKTPPKEICQLGTLIAPGKCVFISPASFKCPPGYENNGKACTLVETEVLQEECSSGSSPCSDGCCMTEISPVEMVCPLPQMNRRHKKSGGTSCVRFEEVPPEPYCQSNFQLNGDFCSGVQMAPCPSKQVAAPPKKVAPPRKLGGRHRQNVPETDYCPAPARFPVSYRCPPGSINIEERRHHHQRGGLTCLLPRPIPLEPVCRIPGGVISPDGSTCQATKIVPPVKRCHHDFADCGQMAPMAQQGAGQCCKLITSPPIPYCTNGEFVDGKCRVYSSSEFVCYGSSTLINGFCHESDTRPALTPALQRSHKKH